MTTDIQLCLWDQIRWWPQNCLKTTFCRAATLKAAEDVIWMAVWGPALNGAALNEITMLWPASNWMSKVKRWQRRGEADRNKKKIDSQTGREREKITPNEYKRENNAMKRHNDVEGGEKKSNKREKNHNTKGGGSGCSFPEEWNLPKPQLSFITAHGHVAILATEPNKPLDRIRFLISQMLSGSTAPRSRSANTGSLYLQPPLHTILLIRDTCVHSSTYLSLWICTS